MGNFFKELRKLFASFEGLENSIYVKRGKDILSLLSHTPLKKVKSIDKKHSFVEKLRISLLEEGFRIHIRDRRKKFIDPITGKKENFYFEITYTGEEVILKTPFKYRLLSFEENPQKVLNEIDTFLKGFLFTDEIAPEKEHFQRFFSYM